MSMRTTSIGRRADGTSAFPPFESVALAAFAALTILGVSGCGTAPPKQAGCPEGTIEKDGSCMPPEGASASGDSSGGTSGGSSDSSGSSGSGSSGSGSSGSSGSGGGDTATASSGDKVPWDKDMVDKRLKRAAEQVKGHCGGATEEDGKSVGPWGKTKVTVTLDNNGHSRDTTIPAPFDGTAVGRCATNAFNGFQYPPFAGPDTKIDYDVEIVKPGK